jgi:hypothetical protein
MKDRRNVAWFSSGVSSAVAIKLVANELDDCGILCEIMKIQG